MIDPKRLICIITVFLFSYSPCYAQQHANSDQLLYNVGLNAPNTYIALAGEGTLSTYGAAVSFPVYWIDDRIKAVPLFGLMWQNFVDEGFNVRPAAGAKLTYYFQRKTFGTAPMNSFYAGLGGMGTINRFFGNSIHEYSRGGVFAGYNFSIGEIFRLAPELFLGANESGKFRAEIGIVLYFGR
jgi:hypothetical protein